MACKISIMQYSVCMKLFFNVTVTASTHRVTLIILLLIFILLLNRALIVVDSDVKTFYNFFINRFHIFYYIFMMCCKR